MIKVMKRSGLALVLTACVFSSRAFCDLEGEEDVKPEPERTITSSKPNEKPSPIDHKGVKGHETPVAQSSPSPTISEEIKESSNNKSKEPVKFQSSGLTGYKEQGTMELEKDVVITQADTKMEADKVKAFYDPKTKEVVRIVATGNVRITKDDPDPQKRAKSTSNEAVFFNKERKVVLRGNPQLVRAGGDTVKGKEIIYELDTGWVKVERVEGVLMPQSEPQPTKAGTTKKKK